MLDGRYELDHEIGRGGTGAVWLGHDTVLGRTVAVKQIGLLPGVDAPDLERAEREAHLAARVNHDHVVAVYDVVDDGDQQWLVMEHVDGYSLDALIALRGSLDEDELEPLAAQVASALAAAHQHGIVHRDVKPSNILMTQDGVAKLSDFGVARVQADSPLTRTGVLIGSPAYLSPEVATGRSATPASDVWSLGATLFHAASGRPPYEIGDDVLGAMHRIVSEDPPRLPGDGPLSVLVTAMMSRDPADRPTMAEVEEALAPHLPTASDHSGDIFTPAPTVPSVLAEPAEPRRRLPWVVVAAAAAVLVIAALALTLGGSDDDPAPPLASETSEPAPEPTTPTSEAPTAPTAEMLEGFVGDYLTAASNDPPAGFAMLTPEFQRESDGLKGYEGFWGRVSSVDVQSVTGNPDDMTVSYRYRYDLDGDRKTDDVTLKLVESDGSFLISGES